MKYIAKKLITIKNFNSYVHNVHIYKCMKNKYRDYYNVICQKNLSQN